MWGFVELSCRLGFVLICVVSLGVPGHRLAALGFRGGGRMPGRVPFLYRVESF